MQTLDLKEMELQEITAEDQKEVEGGSAGWLLVGIGVGILIGFAIK